MNRPEPSEYPEYFKNYISLVPDDSILKILDDQVMNVQEFLSRVPEEKEEFRYAPGKWTIKEIIGHITDTERIMAYRTLRFARKDKTPLSGFDENQYIANTDFNKRTLYDLGHEFAVVRESTILLARNLNEDILSETGNANGKDVTVRAILYMIAGHTIHHLNVIHSRYLMG